MYFLTVCHGLCEPICRHIHNHCTECHPCMSQHSISIRTFTLLQEVTWAGATAIADFCLSPSLYRLAYCMCVVHASESAHVHALSQWTLTRCEFTQCTVHGKDALLRNHGEEALRLRNDQAGGGGNMRSANLASSIRTTAMQVRRWCL